MRLAPIALGPGDVTILRMFFVSVIVNISVNRNCDRQVVCFPAARPRQDRAGRGHGESNARRRSRMDKVVASPAEAVFDIGDGASVGIARFGVSHRFPSSLIKALHDSGSSGLTVYCNGLGQPGFPTAHLLADNHQIARPVTCFSARPGVVSEAERQIQAGEMSLEMVAQGTLVERMRAGGTGIPAFYTPTAVGTALAEGKGIRYFDGKPYVLEHAITTDFALVRAHRADRLVDDCDFEITAAGCVDTVVTDLALLRRCADGFRVDEIARGFTVEDVISVTAMTVSAADDVRVLQDCW
jgi:3-oxoacid CoA-transferase A subunit